MSREEQSAMSVSLNQLLRRILSVPSQVPHQRYDFMVFLVSYSYDPDIDLGCNSFN